MAAKDPWEASASAHKSSISFRTTTKLITECTLTEVENFLKTVISITQQAFAVQASFQSQNINKSCVSASPYKMRRRRWRIKLTITPSARFRFFFFFFTKAGSSRPTPEPPGGEIWGLREPGSIKCLLCWWQGWKQRGRGWWIDAPASQQPQWASRGLKLILHIIMESDTWPRNR